MATYFLSEQGMSYATSIEPRFECTVEIRSGGEVASVSGSSGKHKSSATSDPLPSPPKQAHHVISATAAARYDDIVDEPLDTSSPSQQRHG